MTGEWLRNRRLPVLAFCVRRYLAYRRFLRLTAAERESSPEPRTLLMGLLRRGPVFIKLGQILSTRPDVLPGPYLSALVELQERVPPFDYSEVRRTIQEELGKDIEDVFTELEESPTASASLSQVHFARLKDGTEVAVKVQRPGVGARVRQDLRVFEDLLRVAGFFFPGLLRRGNLMNGFLEFRRYTLQELDFCNEGETIDRFRKNFAGWDDIVFPRVHWTHTTARLLTLSRVSGMRLQEAVRSLTDQKKRALCVRLAEMELKMFISDGLFHADLHPGNVFFGPDASIVLLDFGMYGELSRTERDRFVLYWLAVTQNQVRRAFHHFRAQCVELPGCDEDAFYKEFRGLANEFYASRLADVSVTKVYLRMMRAGYRHGYLFPANLLLHAKALTTAEALAFTLVPEMRFEEVTRPIIMKELARIALENGRPRERLEALLPEILLLGELPPGQTGGFDGRRSGAPTVWSAIYDEVITRIRSWESNAGAPRSIVDGPARDVLSKSMPPSDVDRVMGDTWDEYLRREPDLPAQSTLGATLTLHLAAATLAVYRALSAAGKTRAQASGLIFEVGWRVYRRMGEMPLLIAGLFSGDPRKRMEIATQMFRWFPFGSPAYQWETAEGDDRTVAFDCTKCPVAEYFARFQLADVCHETWCKLDYPLAEMWGGRLERNGTIAGGAGRCDFRWRTP